ncbi:ABC transporter ATP-binding protein/permease [Streptomyces sp. NBC_01795]|uniref:ABC transporter ATP-binding protein/permease n=1 Tax=Streptomyces sp. NBC_01795 TaxID=2975943 RepID=UPI002DD91134|nr:ATP-binding cassette domain-containing protein [Streptomyces sp. NBC_01795]WSA90413.1 ABC transporter ATP-binding protein/permease [Streptomyces sp. NBC_01795]
MSLLMGPPAGASSSLPLTAAPIRARSVIPGRQRWEVVAIRGRPHLARLLERILQAAPGVEGAEANPVTGRVLFRHDQALTPREAAELLRRTALQVFSRTLVPRSRAPQAAPREDHGEDAGPSSRVSQRREGPRSSRSSVLLLGGGAAAVTLGCGKLCLGFLARPWVSLGIAAAATVGIVRRAWRGSDRTGSSGAPSRGPFLTRLVGKHRGRFGFAAVLSGLAQITEMGLYSLMAYGVSVLLTGGSSALAGMGLVGLGSQLPFLAGATALTAACSAGLTYGAEATWDRLGQTVEHEWRTATYEHVLRLTTMHMEGERTTQTLQVLTEDIGEVGCFVGRSLHEVVQLATSLAVLVPAFLLLAPQLAWVAFAPVPVVAWLSFRFQERTATAYEASSGARSRLQGRMAGSLQAHATVKASCTEEYEAKLAAELSEEYGFAEHQTNRRSARHAQLVRMCALSAIPGTLLLGSKAVLRNELPLHRFTPLVDMPVSVLFRLNRLGAMTSSYHRSRAAFDRVRRLHELPVEPQDIPASPVPTDLAGGFALKRVNFSYSGRPPALRDLSMRIAPGQITGIVGTTGAGKTTIARLLMRFVDPTEGEVQLDGVDIRTMPLRQLRGAIGYVSQEPFLFDGTIADNIRYGTFDADDKGVAQAAEAAGADLFIQALPDGYDTKVGEGGAALSGGQKQRVALARTILGNPPVVILDEATSAVDNETEAAIQRGLDTFAHKRTLLVIAHRLSTIRNADAIYVLERGGRVSEQGTHSELVLRGGRYAALWRLQAGEEPSRRNAG